MMQNATTDFVHFKEDHNQWSPLEIICHLIDEEREDFRARIKFLLANPETQPPPIDPKGWVLSRKYADQDFHEKLSEWEIEREKSVGYLKTLSNIDTTIGFDHNYFGRFTIQYLLTNWLAHDLLHIRQLTRCRYQHLQKRGDIDIIYAGKW